MTPTDEEAEGLEGPKD